MHNGLWKFFLMAAILIPLTACETMGLKEEEKTAEAAAVEERAAATAAEEEAAEAARARAMEEAAGFRGHPLDDPENPLAKRVVYFDFDRSEVKDEFRATVEAHAGYLADHSGASITLEGHADERGSREYNIALGERRANAVRRLMVLLGASGDQIRTLSYGEERPAVEGHDESAWRYNRRAEIIYRTR